MSTTEQSLSNPELELPSADAQTNSETNVTDFPSDNPLTTETEVSASDPANDAQNVSWFDEDFLSKLGADDAENNSVVDDDEKLPGFTADTEKVEAAAQAEKPSEDTQNAQKSDTNAKQEENSADAASETDRKESAADSAPKDQLEKLIDDDSELSDDDKKLIKAMPRNKWVEFRNAKNYARTEAKFLDASEPLSNFLEHLQQKSPSRASALRQEIINQALFTKDESGAQVLTPQNFLANIYDAAGAGNYTEIVTQILKNYPEYTVKVLTDAGYRITQDSDETGDSTSQTADADASGIDDELSELIEKASLYLAPEEVEKLKTGVAFSRKQTASEKPAEQNDSPESKDGAEKAAEVTEESEKENPAPDAVSPEIQTAIVDSSFEIVDSHLQSRFDSEYGLAVSDAELRDMPELAELKNEKRELLLFGNPSGSLPSFADGLVAFAANDETFKKDFTSFWNYVKNGEQENARRVIQKILPTAEAYLAVRMQHPAVQNKDKQIKSTSELYNLKLNREEISDTFIPAGVEGADANNGTSAAPQNVFLDPSSL